MLLVAVEGGTQLACSWVLVAAVKSVVNRKLRGLGRRHQMTALISEVVLVTKLDRVGLG